MKSYGLAADICKCFQKLQVLGYIFKSCQYIWYNKGWSLPRKFPIWCKIDRRLVTGISDYDEICQRKIKEYELSCSGSSSWHKHRFCLLTHRGLSQERAFLHQIRLFHLSWSLFSPPLCSPNRKRQCKSHWHVIKLKMFRRGQERNLRAVYSSLIAACVANKATIQRSPCLILLHQCPFKVHCVPSSCVTSRAGSVLHCDWYSLLI